MPNGLWQWLPGLTNVNSPNQQITAKFGIPGRKNSMEAVSGAEGSDFVRQAGQAVAHRATYVSVFLEWYYRERDFRHRLL